MSDRTDVQFDAVDAGRVAPGTNTATGQAQADRDGTQPKEDDSDQTLSPTADKVKADYLSAKPAPAIGQQKEEAMFAVNGSIPANVIPSTSGWVPASAVHRDPEAAANAVEQNIITFQEGLNATNSRQKISPEKIQQMSGAELRAVASDRGYPMSEAMGTRAVRSAFGRHQDEDGTLDKK